jgi:hypothetical protein
MRRANPWMEESSGSGEQELDLGGFARPSEAVRTTRAAGPGAGAERLVDDRLHGPRASPAFDAAAQAVIDLLGIPRQVRSRAHGIAHIMVGQNVAGTNNHARTAGPIGDASIDLLNAVARCKKKNRILKQFQTDARRRLEPI